MTVIARPKFATRVVVWIATAATMEIALSRRKRALNVMKSLLEQLAESSSRLLDREATRRRYVDSSGESCHPQIHCQSKKKERRGGWDINYW
jgi:hypothetical protein